MTIHIVYISAGSTDEARRIAKALVEEKLAACANILANVHSFYYWNGDLQDDREAVIIAKTTAARLAALTDRVKALHPYQCPCIVNWPLAGGYGPFLEWVGHSVAPPS
jgi:periplasmic divalent cation tolerance protein